MSILLLIVIAILLFCTIRGYKKGLFGIIFGIISWVFITVCLIYGTPKMNETLRANASFYDKVYSSVEKYVSAKVDESGIPDVSSDTINSLGSGAAEKINSYGSGATGMISQDEINKKVQENLSLLPPGLADQIQSMTESGSLDTDSIISDIQNGASQQVASVKEAVTAKITKTVTNYVISVLAFVFTLLIAWVIVLILAIIIKVIELNRGVKTASHWLGLVFGLAEGFLLVFIILYIISAVSMITNGQLFAKDISGNAFLGFLYTHNPIANFFMKK